MPRKKRFGLGERVVLYAGDGYIPVQIIQTMHPHYKVQRRDPQGKAVWEAVKHTRDLFSLRDAVEQGLNVHRF